MKYFQLLACAKHFQQFKFINSIQRVEDNILHVRFENKNSIFFDLQKSNSTIFMCDDFLITKKYQAPFDLMLQKRFTKSKIKSLKILPNNRILEIKVAQENNYKLTNTTIHVEFTGRNTNAIIVDEKKIVLEALRHIDKSISFRSVKVGELLEDLPEFELNEKIHEIDNIEIFLYENYKKRQNSMLENYKTQKKLLLDKKIVKIKNLLNTLDDKKKLEDLANLYNKKATLLLANKHVLNDYDKNITILDFDGKNVNIQIDKEFRTLQETIDKFFQKSKKLKQKAKSLHIEKETLSEKLKFLNNLDYTISHAKSKEEMNVLLPKKNLKTKQEAENSGYSSFFIEGYKIMVGKNEKGNAELLKIAKKNDVWLHVKNTPSSHVIIRSDKQNAPVHIVEFAAKLCVSLSGLVGSFLVDYTQRRNVKIIENANVTYVEYKTIKISIN